MLTSSRAILGRFVGFVRPVRPLLQQTHRNQQQHQQQAWRTGGGGGGGGQRNQRPRMNRVAPKISIRTAGDQPTGGQKIDVKVSYPRDRRSPVVVVNQVPQTATGTDQFDAAPKYDVNQQNVVVLQMEDVAEILSLQRLGADATKELTLKKKRPCTATGNRTSLHLKLDDTTDIKFDGPHATQLYKFLDRSLPTLLGFTAWKQHLEGLRAMEQAGRGLY